jgi:hypothetical protein
MAVKVTYHVGNLGKTSEIYKQATGYVVRDGQLELHRKCLGGVGNEQFMIWADGSWFSAELLEDKNDGK